RGEGAARQQFGIQAQCRLLRAVAADRQCAGHGFAFVVIGETAEVLEFLRHVVVSRPLRAAVTVESTPLRAALMASCSTRRSPMWLASSSTRRAFISSL